MRTWLLVSVLAMLSCAGCSASHEGEDDLDVGARDARASDAGVDAPRDAWVRPDGALPDVRLRDTGVIGPLDGEVWEGYVESHVFPSGSDRVRIVFDAASGDGPRTGIVVFGDAAPPPPVTNPDVGYPPGRPASRVEIYEGLEYRITEARVDGDRVQITIDLGQLLEVWCQLQTPYAQGPAGPYLCRPASSATGSASGSCYYEPREGGERVAADCAWLDTCGGFACTCDASGCVASPGNTVQIDFHVTGDDGDGSMPLGNIHLSRL